MRPQTQGETMGSIRLTWEKRIHRAGWLGQQAGAMALIFAAFCAGAGVWGSCRQEHTGILSGRVENLFGQAMEATVSIQGLEHSVVADRDGRYELPYIPGQFKVRYQVAGHVPFVDRESLFSILLERDSLFDILDS